MIKLARTLLRNNSWFVAAFQSLLVIFSLILAWLLRFDFSLPDRSLLWVSVPVLVLVRMAPIAFFGLLHGWWRYTGFRDLKDVLKAIFVGSAAFILVMRYIFVFQAFPRSVYLLEPLLTAGLLIGVRVCSRALAESVRQDLGSCRKVILVGAGIAAHTLIREVKKLKTGYTPVGCVDDDLSKLGLKIEGVPVIGRVDDLPRLVKKYPVDEVLIAIPSASGHQMRHFVEVCEKAQVKFRTVPALCDVISGKAGISELRQVHVEDLLGRQPVEIDMDSVKHQISGRTVLVTGAAGSIGSELCRQVLQYEPRALLCVDQSETGIFYLQRELSPLKKMVLKVFYVADVGDGDQMQKLFLEYSPQVIFHAAAYKHVPVMETNVRGAIKNNIFGLLELIRVAQESNCESFVLISSDKAVNPTSVMGVTKRIGELIISGMPACGMRSVSVRFGNVLGSSGSVIPVLKEQLRNNQPLTITHPEMKRFFMTTREAVSLVLQAFAIGNQGETLVLDMGPPVRILDLARTLVHLSGKTDEEVNIKFTGLRGGEKMIEELFYPHEKVYSTSSPKIKRARSVGYDWSELQSHLDDLRGTLYLDGAAPIRAKIKEIVPEYSYPGNAVTVADDTSERSSAAVGRS